MPYQNNQVHSNAVSASVGRQFFYSALIGGPPGWLSRLLVCPEALQTSTFCSDCSKWSYFVTQTVCTCKAAWVNLDTSNMKAHCMPVLKLVCPLLNHSLCNHIKHLCSPSAGLPLKSPRVEESAIGCTAHKHLFWICMHGEMHRVHLCVTVQPASFDQSVDLRTASAKLC